MVSNERLRELKAMKILGFADSVTCAEIGEMIDEILALRTLPAMAEVDALEKSVIQCLAQIVMSRGGEDGSAIDCVPSGLYQKLRDLIYAMISCSRRAIASAEAERRRADEAEKKVAERDAEIERLRMAVGCATTIKGDMVIRADDPLGMMQEVSAYVTTLTAERDEARSELEDAQRQEIETIAAVINHRKLIDEQKQKIDFLTAELAALKSAPGMGEVDMLSGDFTVEECDQPCLTTWMQRNKSLADIARRSIASREEEAKRADEVNKEYSDFIEKIIQAVKDGLSGQRDGMFQALRDCEAFAMSANMDQLFRGVVCQFGLVQQGHIPTIEAMLGEGASWEEIGLKIGWCHKTAEQHYNAYLKGKRDNDHA